MPKRTRGSKPDPLSQSRRVLTNQLARDERTEHLLNLERSGRQSHREFPAEVAVGINRLVGPKRLKRLKATSKRLLEQRRQTEKNNNRKEGTKRKITPRPSPTPSLIHTDYSTNTERWIEPEPKPEKIQSFREAYMEQPEGRKTTSGIFEATQKKMREQASKRNAETKSRSQKRAKTQSAPKPEPGLLEQVENLVGNVLHKISTFTKLKGT